MTPFSRAALGLAAGLGLLAAAGPAGAADRAPVPDNGSLRLTGTNGSFRPGPGEASRRATLPAKPYTLAPGDRVEMKVFQHADMTTLERIGEDGEITLPLLGRVRLAGLTEDEAKVHVHDLYQKDYFVEPQVSLSVVEKGRWKFTVSGQVIRPGTYEAMNGESLDLIEAISRAGDFTGKGRKSDVQIIRKDQPPIYRNVEQMMRGKQPPFEIKPGDQIFVKERII
jgi:polysaccharide export outer membrane protein